MVGYESDGGERVEERCERKRDAVRSKENIVKREREVYATDPKTPRQLRERHPNEMKKEKINSSVRLS